MFAALFLIALFVGVFTDTNIEDVIAITKDDGSTLTRSCPSFPPLNNFNATQIIGSWYAAYLSRWRNEQMKTCQRAEYTIESDGTLHIAHYYNIVGNPNSMNSNTTYQPVNGRPGQFEGENATFSPEFSDFSNATENYFSILKFDEPRNFYYVMCTGDGSSYELKSGIVIRQPTVRSEEFDSAKDLFRSMGIDSEYFYANQEECGY